MSENESYLQQLRGGEENDSNKKKEYKGKMDNRVVRKVKNKKKTNTEGVMYCKNQKNKNDKAIGQHRSHVIISEVEFSGDRSINIGVGFQDIDRILKECQSKGGTYPPEDVMLMFKKTMEGLEVRESRVAAWSKKRVLGLFLKKGFKRRRGMVIGVYGGKLTLGVGPYVLQFVYDDGQKFRVDAEGAEGKRGYLE